MVIAWWSGGITSAVTCKLCLELYSDVRVIFIDTFNEDVDTYRFKKDCEQWYGVEIETITGIGDKYQTIEDVWERYNSLNVATGAICSTELKRSVREEWEKHNTFTHQAFGFELDEVNRARAMKLNYSHTNPIFPLLMYGLSKKDCIKYVQDAGVDVPNAYDWGFLNNNCMGKTEDTGGCVQGGIGYWQKMRKMFPKKFDAMSAIEHRLTDKKGKPVTMLKDQSKEAKDNGTERVFLKPHPDYPHLKDISMMKGREPKPLFECNGFCGTNDLMPKNPTEDEINFGQQTLF